jgi:hypothetical protein
MEQMMERMLAKMDSFQEIKITQSKMEAKTDGKLERMEANQGNMDTKTDANLKEITAEMRAWRKVTTACQEGMEASLESKEPASVETEFESEHKDVPKEEAAVEIFGALKELYWDRHLAVGCRRQLQKRTQGDGGSRKLAATRRGMNRAGAARHKRHGHIGPTVQKRRPKNRTRTLLHEESRKNRRSGRDVGRNRNTTTA